MPLSLSAAAALAAPPRLLVRTWALPASRLPGGPQDPDLLALLAGQDDVVSWVREGRGLVGLGRALELRAQGETRIEDLRAAWRATVYASWWADPLVRPGTGPVAVGAISFSPGSTATSVLVVPELLVGLDEQGAWITRTQVRAAGTEALPLPPEPSVEEVLASLSLSPAPVPEPVGAVTAPGAQAETAWMDSVERARSVLLRGDLAKVVLARDVTAVPRRRGHTGDLLRRLAAAYPSCWTFAADGMLGASPELLVRLRERRLTSRVLAGTARRHGGSAQERAAEAVELARWLAASSKNNREHALARASALEALEPLCSVVECPERFVLTLPNVLHLASDLTGVVAGDTGALSLVGALHPTAAVCGTPRQAAAALIEELEGMDRGRYAGPAGWVDWRGEGEWCIALRSAQLAGDGSGGLSPQQPLRVFGGGGIMPDSEAADELAETQAKMRPVLEALGAVG